MVFGPPGTGKTTYLVQHASTKQGTVTFCSHTRTAARAALTMAEKQGAVTTDWKASTIHSICFKALGLSRAQVVADHNLEAFCKVAGFTQGEQDENAGPSDLSFYQHAYGYALTTGHSYDAAFEVCGALGSRTDFTRFCITYTQWKDAYGFVDYVDMLILSKQRGFTQPMGSLIVDEAQDLTPLHWGVVERMMEVADDITVAGDDDQAIFQWSGADPQGMTKFAVKHDSKVRVLSQSYRVPKTVHRLAQDIAAKMVNRQHKEYAPRDAKGVVDAGVTLGKQQLRDMYRAGSMLILFRNKYARIKYEKLLQEELVPYTTDVHTSPLQKRSGRAFELLKSQKWADPADIRVIRSGLTQYGLALANSTTYAHVAAFLDGDLATDVLNCNHREMSYLQNVKLAARRVDLRTMHSAKGMEAESVVVVSSMTHSSIETLYKDPSSEHRVHYVAVTRAKTNLLLITDNNAYPFPARAA